MSALRSDSWTAARMNALAWFGVLGGPLAWAVQFLIAMQLGLARCESPGARFRLPVTDWAIGLGAAGVLVGLLAELTAIAIFRATRERPGDSSVTRARLHFLAAVGMTVNPLTLTICAMVAVGVPVLSLCHQS